MLMSFVCCCIPRSDVCAPGPSLVQIRRPSWCCLCKNLAILASRTLSQLPPLQQRTRNNDRYRCVVRPESRRRSYNGEKTSQEARGDLPVADMPTPMLPSPQLLNSCFRLIVLLRIICPFKALIVKYMSRSKYQGSRVLKRKCLLQRMERRRIRGDESARSPRCHRIQFKLISTLRSITRSTDLCQSEASMSTEQWVLSALVLALPKPSAVTDQIMRHKYWIIVAFKRLRESKV